MLKKPEKTKFAGKQVCYHCRYYNHGGSQCRRYPEYVRRGEGDTCGEYVQRTLSQEIGVEE